MAGNIVYGGKNIALEQSQFNNSSTLRDSSTAEVSSRVENEVEENLFTLGNKWVTKDRNKRKCKRLNIEKMKLNMEIEKVILLKTISLVLALL